MLNIAQLRAVCPHCTRPNDYLPHLNAALQEFDIATPERIAAALAQFAHESGEFRWLAEIWGPTPAQLLYEPPASKAFELGNTQPGDGKLFKGRGVIQLTGRGNYRAFGFENSPERLADADQAFRIGGWFWKTRGLNALADAADFDQLTRRINGGLSGYASRLRYWAAAKKALGVT